jgi:hypothetical protein
MKTCIKIWILLSLLFLTACVPSDVKIQQALAQTQAAWTPVPSQTAYPTYTMLPSQTAYPTYTPVILTPTRTIPPITPTPTVEAWPLVSGTWSGCTAAPQAELPYYATACTDPIGGFVTLYLQPQCVVGEFCGNYIKAAFASEYIQSQLTLLGIEGAAVRMHADAGEMYPESSTDVTLERAGDNLRIIEKTGQQFIFVLPLGCDPVILANTSIGCSEHIP